MRKLTMTFNGEVMWEAEWSDRAPIRKQLPQVEASIHQFMEGKMVLDDDIIGATNIVRDCLRDNIDLISKANKYPGTVEVDKPILAAMGTLLPFLNEKYGVAEVNFWTKEVQGYELAGVNVIDHKGRHIKSVTDNPVLLSE